jgi:hypothetical protein
LNVEYRDGSKKVETPIKDRIKANASSIVFFNRHDTFTNHKIGKMVTKNEPSEKNEIEIVQG